MSTSGSTSFTLTRDQIILQAFQLLGVYAVEGESISNGDLSYASNRLNGMIKHWQTQGMHLFTRTEAVLFLQKDTSQYALSNAATSARACLASNAVLDVSTAAIAAAGTTLTVADSSLYTNTNPIGVVQDSGTIFWTTVSAKPTSTTITLASGITTAAASGNNVYSYSTRINRPLRIYDARLVRGISTTTEVPMRMISHEEYFRYPNKTSSGTPNVAHYDPQLTTGQLYLYPRPSTAATYVKFTYERCIEDFVSSTDNPDVPQEWLDPLIYNLALSLAPTYSMTKDDIELLAPQAIAMLQAALSHDTEQMTISFSPSKH